MHRLHTAIVCFAMLGAIAPSPAFAQRVDQWTAIQQILVDLKADRQAVVAANLPLTEAEARAFWPVYKEFRGAMDALGERVAALLNVYDANLNTMTPERADELVKESLAIERERAEVRDRYMPRVRRVLPAIKAARFYQIEHKLDALVALTLSDEVPLVPIKR